MNTQTQEALKMAIAEIEGWIDHAYGHTPEECADNKALKACKEALAQPAQEPFAWMEELHVDMYLGDMSDGSTYRLVKKPHHKNGRWLPLYTHPAPSWQGLNDYDILSIDGLDCVNENDLIGFAHAIEAKLKEKNT